MREWPIQGFVSWLFMEAGFMFEADYLRPSFGGESACVEKRIMNFKWLCRLIASGRRAPTFIYFEFVTVPLQQKTVYVPRAVSHILKIRSQFVVLRLFVVTRAEWNNFEWPSYLNNQLSSFVYWEYLRLFVKTIRNFRLQLLNTVSKLSHGVGHIFSKRFFAP